MSSRRSRPGPATAREDRHLQCERHQRALARAARLACRSQARCRLPAGAESRAGEVSRAAIRDAGYGAIWHGQKSWNGVAILAAAAARRDPARAARAIPTTHSRYIEAAVHGLPSAACICPTAIPRRDRNSITSSLVRALIAHGAELIDRRSRSCSQATTTSCRPISTSTNPSAGSTTRCFAPRCATRSSAAGPGLDRCAARTAPGRRIYTFWDYFRNAFARDAGLRIDHLLLSPAVADRLVEAGVDRYVRGWEKTSDHAPTWIELAG